MTPNFIVKVEQMFEAAMQTDYPGEVFMFDNTPVADTVGRYAAIHVMASEDTIPINLGITSKSRNVGVIQIDVYTPKDTGTGTARVMAYALGNAFKRLTVPVAGEGQITFKDASVTSRGEVRNRHKHMVSIPYRYDFTDM